MAKQFHFRVFPSSNNVNNKIDDSWIMTILSRTAKKWEYQVSQLLPPYSHQVLLCTPCLWCFILALFSFFVFWFAFSQFSCYFTSYNCMQRWWSTPNWQPNVRREKIEKCNQPGYTGIIEYLVGEQKSSAREGAKILSSSGK